jgi:hypothetical protein
MGSSPNHLLIQSTTGTVIAKASVEIKSIDALSDSAAFYRAAKSTTTVASGKLQHTSASRAKGLTISPAAQSPIEKAMPGPPQGGTLIQCHEFTGVKKLRQAPNHFSNVKCGVDAKYRRHIRRPLT